MSNESQPPKLVIREVSDLSQFERDTQLRIVEALTALRRNPQDGKRLEAPRYRTLLLGDLSQHGCLSWPVAGHYEHTEARIVYRILENGDLDVVAIGRRFKSEAFILAWGRLSPPPPPPRRFRPFR